MSSTLVQLLSKFVTLILLFAAMAFAGFWLGLIPQRFSPLSPLSLEKRDQWFIDLKLAALSRNPVLCHSILMQPYIDSSPLEDKPPTNGCGWMNSVKFTEIENVKIRVHPLTCEMAAALTLWVKHELQPAARAAFRIPIESIEHIGTYNCRNIEGRSMRSQHAVANAIDVSGFKVKDGRRISVLHHWNGNGVEAKFLRRVYRRACRYFRVTLGPDYNPAHADHFHFDRSRFRMCR